MIAYLFFAYVGVATFIALSDWRKGILLMIVAGLLQDPVRKLMPGAPSYMVLTFIPIWLAICSTVLWSGTRHWSRFMVAQPGLGNGFWLMGFSLVLAFVVLILSYGLDALPVGLIGLIGYGFPILAIAVGYFLVRNSSDLLRLITFYCAVTAILLSGGLMENWQLFPDWPALGTGVLEMTWVRHYPGHIVYLTSGFFRSPDLLGWNAALVVMFGMIMVFRASNAMTRLGWMALIVWGATILLMSGRNKMIFMPAVFIFAVGAINLYKGSLGRFTQVAMIGLVSFGLLLGVNSQLGLDQEYLLYTQRGSSEATGRLASGGFLSVLTTYQQSGFFGEGLGSASTGSRYGGEVGIRTWQESGLSKIMVELGVVGFIAGLIFFVGILRSLWRVVKRTPSTAPEFQLYAGFLGIVAANCASFVISHQAFGDPFLVTLTGLLLGVALSAVRWTSGPVGQGR